MEKHWVSLVVAILFLTKVCSGDVCGEEESGAQGYLKLPDTLPPNTTCTWTFTYNSTKLFLSWQFQRLSQGDYLVVYKNSSTDQPVANFTSTSENIMYYTAVENATVVFYSRDGLNGTQPISFLVQFDRQSCLLNINSSSNGVVHAPMYNLTDGHLPCRYTVSLPLLPLDLRKIAMTFHMFDLQKGTLDIYDGKTTKTPLIANYSDGMVDPADIISSGSDLTLQMTLATSVSQAGFWAGFTSISAECSGQVKIVDATENLHITSPGFPGNYSNQLDCRWLIVVPEDMKLRINPLNFSLADDFDHVTIIDGKSRNDRLLARFSASVRPEQESVWMTSGQYVWIQFKSDEVITSPGFNFSIAPIVYGGALIGEGTFVVQRNENESFSATDDIVFTITVQDGEQVELKFNDTERLLYPTSEVLCYDGFTNTSNIVGKFRSDRLFRPVYSSGNIMMIVVKGFVDNSSYASREHFSGYYHGIPNDGSYVNSIGPSGSYQLVGDGDQLNSTAWFVHNHIGGVVALHLSQLHIAPDHFVSIHSGLGEESLEVARFYNSTTHIPVIHVPDARVTYGLIPEGNVTQLSLCDEPQKYKKRLLISASYEIIPDSSYNITDSVGTFSSPNYPEKYPFNDQSTWNISIPRKRTLRVGFNAFRLASNHTLQIEGKSYSNFTFENQSYIIENSTNYGSYMGASVPDDILTMDDELWVTFSSMYDGSDELGVDTGFLAEFESIDCGGIVNIISNPKEPLTLGTPGYPKPVSKNTTCVWILVAPLMADNSSINVINFKYELVDYQNGTGTKLQIRDGGSCSSSEVPLNLPKGVNDFTLARTNKLWIRYSYIEKTPSPFAFKLSYDLYVCGEKEQCSNGVCMHKDWKCNGVDDCGDGSDEKDCTCTAKGAGGIVAPWALALAIVLTFMAAVALTFLVPAIYKRFKYPNYSELRDLMTPVPT